MVNSKLFFFNFSIATEIDWKTVDLNKMKVKELKAVLVDWGETCKACTRVFKILLFFY